MYQYCSAVITKYFVWAREDSYASANRMHANGREHRSEAVGRHCTVRGATESTWDVGVEADKERILWNNKQGQKRQIRTEEIWNWIRNGEKCALRGRLKWKVDTRRTHGENRESSKNELMKRAEIQCSAPIEMVEMSEIQAMSGRVRRGCSGASVSYIYVNQIM